MALMGDSGRTEKATPKRRREALQNGQLARSPGLVAAVVFLGLFLLLSFQLPYMVHSLSTMLHRMLTEIRVTDLSEENLQKLFLQCATDVASAVMLVTGTAILLGVGANAAQGGLVMSTSRLSLRLGNLNPSSGFRRLLPATAGMELLKIVLVVSAVSYSAYGVYTDAQADLPRLVLMSPLDISGRIGRLVYRFATKGGFLLLVIGAADYFWNRLKFEKSIRMTKQEIKEEAKNAEGNPEVRSKIRSKQRQMALRNMMAAVPKADVIVTNPTHYAVALSYKPQTMVAPVVVAKGKGFVALRIKELAAENKVPMVENKPLARGLYKTVEIGQQIPAELFKAVAELLAHVYRLKATRL